MYCLLRLPTAVQHERGPRKPKVALKERVSPQRQLEDCGPPSAISATVAAAGHPAPPPPVFGQPLPAQFKGSPPECQVFVSPASSSSQGLLQILMSAEKYQVSEFR